jgi:predicted nuclease of predicted toxin-antitoxin system
MLSITHDSKPSIVHIRASVLYAEQFADFIADSLFQNADELEKGAILSIDVRKARLRLLPL